MSGSCSFIASSEASKLIGAASITAGCSGRLSLIRICLARRSNEFDFFRNVEKSTVFCTCTLLQKCVLMCGFGKGPSDVKLPTRTD
jgi:hypothetical protein